MNTFFLFLLSLTGMGLAQEKPQIRFGILQDGPSPNFEREFLGLVKQEIRALLERDFEVEFPEQARHNAQFDLQQIHTDLDALLADPEIDIVLCLGALSTIEAAGRGPFDKPVFAPFGIDPTLPMYPRSGDASGIHNFNYLVTPTNIARDVAMMKKMKPVTRVHMVIQDLFAQQIPQIQAFVESTFASEGLKVAFLQVGSEPKSLFKQLNPEMEMLYITPLIRFSNEQKSALFDTLKSRSLPTFSMLGREEVELGAMAGLAPKSDTLRWVRRLALNVQRSLLGEDPGDLPVIFRENSKLVLNMATARSVGWYPAWDLQISADLINEDRTVQSEKIDLETAIQRALAHSPSLAASALELREARARLESAQALVRPDLGATLTGVQVDSDSADASFGLQPEKSAAAKITAQQVLFSDGLNANIAIQRNLLEASAKAYRADQLNLTLEIAERYFEFLKAHNLYQVRRDNLDRTSSHLETAKTRQAVGLANPAEVYRWQAQLANDKLASIEAKNQSDQALYALNRLLGSPQEQPLQGLMPDMMDPEMRSNFARITQYVGNEHEFERFRAFMVQEALRDAPELARIQALMAAQKRSLQTANRAFYLPTIALQGSLENEFYRSDSENPLLNLLPPGAGAALPTAPETSWNVALQFSLPLYSGGKRHQDQALAQFGLDRLELQRQEVSEQLELRVRASLQALASTSVGIQLREEAAQAALKSLELMEDAYAQGVASPIDLIDSQNTALVAQIAATNARHDYFLALMRFQRASGNFDVFLTTQEREAFYQRLNAFYATEKE